ncbi:hypothetical protein RvY_04502 [Ramazzottius varieornatus]|uniref:Uncharacterized protein n=1 Tax=Ramazzottius varieornatus TaxID=947166 RepID=A0A1D1URT4_RAMVA|nr:hypothetical protein RvY_04502 [Ramazzottius varieornatus]
MQSVIYGTLNFTIETPRCVPSHLLQFVAVIRQRTKIYVPSPSISREGIDERKAETNQTMERWCPAHSDSKKLKGEPVKVKVEKKAKIFFEQEKDSDSSSGSSSGSSSEENKSHPSSNKAGSHASPKVHIH